MRRVPELDSLRGLAAVGVVLFHAFPKRFFLGWCLVDLFFVLSAYLITTILLRHLESPRLLRSFYARRVLRIWPLYYAVLAGVLALNAASPRGYPGEGLVQHLTFTQNVQHVWFTEAPAFVPAFAPSWSLAVEEQFYVVWPLLLLALGRGAVIPVASLAIVTGITCRALGMAPDVFPTRCDGIAAGAILAVLLEDRDNFTRERRRGLGMAFLGAICAGGTYAFGLAMVAGGRTDIVLPSVTVAMLVLLFLGVVGLTVLYDGHAVLAPLRWPPLVYVGAISYGLYLLHVPILMYTEPALGRLGVTGPGTIASLKWGLIVGLPMATYHLLEQPLFRLKSRFPYEAPALATEDG